MLAMLAPKALKGSMEYPGMRVRLLLYQMKFDQETMQMYSSLAVER